MFQDLMNMEGVAVLSKQQQSNVLGGQKCVLTYNGEQHIIEFRGFESDDPNASGRAESECVSLIGGGETSRCHYDCEHDGLPSLEG